MLKIIKSHKRIFTLCLTIAVLITSVVSVSMFTAQAKNTYDDSSPALDFTVITNGTYYNGTKSTGTFSPGAGVAPTDGNYVIRTNSFVTWYDEDDIAFAYKKYDIGDSSKDNLTVETTITSHVPDTDGISELHTNASAGIMMRDGLNADAPDIFLHARNEYVTIVYRMSKGQEMKVEYAMSKPTYPLKLRLVREGKVFSGYYMCANDNAWRKVATVSALFKGPTYAGLCAHSCQQDVFVKSTFNGFTAKGEGTYSGTGGDDDPSSSGSSSGSETSSLEQLPGPAPEDVPFDPEKEPDVLLYENFSDGSRVKGPESVSNPIWKNPTGELTEFSNGNRVWYKNYVDSHDFIGDKNWSDYNTSVDIAFSSLANPQLDNKFVLYVRHREYVMYGAADYSVVIESYHYAENGKLQYDAAKNPIRKLRAYISKRVGRKLGSIPSKPVEGTDYYYINDDWITEGGFHNISVDSFDNVITLCIDGIKALEYTDTNAVTNSFGNIGFETLNTSMYIDNIKVTKLHDEQGGDYDNYVCGLWDQKEPEYIAEQGVPYYAFGNDGKTIWKGFDDRR